MLYIKLHRFSALWPDRRGQLVPLMAFTMVALVAMAGLAIDGGRLFWVKRQMQSAADAGALAGAFELQRGHTEYGSELRPAVANDTALNGFNDENSTITVNHPPVSGRYAGDGGYVEVVIEQPVESTFARMMRERATIVSARSVAGIVGYADACMIALNPTANRAFRLNGDPVIQANCGLMSNSGDDWGLVVNGNPTVRATYFGVVGEYRQTGGTADIQPDPTEGAVAVPDPFKGLPVPDYSGWSAGSFNKNTGLVSCPGGHCVFNSRLKISGPKADVYFPPGEYVLLNGMQINSNLPVNGDEVFFFTSGSKGVEIASNGTVTFTPPKSGDYKGILFFGDPAFSGVSNNFGRGTADFQCRGTLYYPTQHLDFAGTFVGTTTWGMMIADTLQFHGNTDYYVFNQPPEEERPDYGTVMLAE